MDIYIYPKIVSFSDRGGGKMASQIFLRILLFQIYIKNLLFRQRNFIFCDIHLKISLIYQQGACSLYNYVCDNNTYRNQ